MVSSASEPAATGLLVQPWPSGVVELRLDRPTRHNALDGPLVAALVAALEEITIGEWPRAVLLTGAGPSFCAGADLGWMQAMAAQDEAANLADARRLARLLALLDDCPAPTVAAVQGVALGGGLGLLACCDIVLAAADARFGFTEAKLGLLPAVIAPFVVAKIGIGQARALFASGERFDAERALRLGLVHQVVLAPTLAAAVERQLSELLTSAPGAAAAARALVRRVATGRPVDHAEATARLIARLRASDEGREGLAAFQERRPPVWVSGSER